MYARPSKWTRQSRCTGQVRTRSNGSGSVAGSGRSSARSASHAAATVVPVTGQRRRPALMRSFSSVQCWRAGSPGKQRLLDVQRAHHPAAALGLALLLRRPRQAGIDMEAHGLGVGSVLGVDHAPGAGAVADAGLQVVDAVDRGHAAQADERLGVGMVPRQLIHRPAPHHRRVAAVAEHHDEAIERDRPTGIPDVHVAELDPVGLGLRSGRRLDAAEWPQLRLGEVAAQVLPDRLLAAGVVVLLDQVGPQRLAAGGAVGGQGLHGAFAPVRHGLGQAQALDQAGLRRVDLPFRRRDASGW